MFHVAFSSGSVFSGKHTTLWGLDHAALKRRVLDLRALGEEVWVEGQPLFGGQVHESASFLAAGEHQRVDRGVSLV